jgi:predicted DCC family thiol-disulfide oxidoreductase YuxK
MNDAATTTNAKQPYRVFYDGMCPVCKKSKRALTRMDWFNRLEFHDIHDRTTAEKILPDVSYADMLREMYVQKPTGKHHGGYHALRALAPALPLMWPALPLMWLPGAAWLGGKVYRYIARNRFKRAACDSEVCSLHLKLMAGKEVDDEVVAQVIELHEKQRQHQQ